MRGRWADGIQPRNLVWVVKERLAICERPGGYGANHRAVRRTEEIIWIRRHDFDCIVSLLSGPHNLHSYDELEMPHLHLPLGEVPGVAPLLAAYEEITRRVEAGERLLLHHERVDDALAGFLAGYWLWMGLHTDVPSALHATERLLRRPVGQRGRETVLGVAASGIRRRARPTDDDPDGTTGGSGTSDTSATGITEPPATPAWRMEDR
ncbi:MAG: hypothetical protein OXI26_08185 [bacterium]|nr:hypothetical protein [bacterium]